MVRFSTAKTATSSAVISWLFVLSWCQVYFHLQALPLHLRMPPHPFLLPTSVGEAVITIMMKQLYTCVAVGRVVYVCVFWHGRLWPCGAWWDSGLVGPWLSKTLAWWKFLSIMGARAILAHLYMTVLCRNPECAVG